MDAEATIAYLIDLVQSLNIEVRPRPASGDSDDGPAGSMVRLRGQEILFLDPSAPPPDQVELLASVLRGRAEIENRYLPPEIRDAIDGP